MTTDTIREATTANARALRVEAAVRDGRDTRAMLLEQTRLDGDELTEALTWLQSQGRVEVFSNDEGEEFYTAVEPRMTSSQRNELYLAHARAPKERTPSGFDRITEVPDPRVAALIKANAAKAREAAGHPAIPPQQGGEQAAEMPAAARARRIGKGGQEEMILDYLRAHPTAAFSPYELGRLLAPAGHKPLGVRDACARLAARRMITVAQERPVRYCANR